MEIDATKHGYRVNSTAVDRPANDYQPAVVGVYANFHSHCTSTYHSPAAYLASVPMSIFVAT